VERRPPRRVAFVAGAAHADRVPPPARPEIAFAGRSNVGKSSLLNRLVGRRGLARVSKTPGRTQQINFFDLDDTCRFVDLPGYGFARVPLAIKARWRGLVEGYLRGRTALRGVLVLIDARRGLQAEDAQLLDFLDAIGARSQVVVTKVDKLSGSDRARVLASVERQRPAAAPIAFSAHSGEGTDDLWAVVGTWLAD
jgi:GTP-binding protein